MPLQFVDKLKLIHTISTVLPRPSNSGYKFYNAVSQLHDLFYAVKSDSKLKSYHNWVDTFRYQNFVRYSILDTYIVFN